MHPASVETPPYLAGPLRLEPFRGMMLSPGRVGDPASARLFARPYRSVGRRLDTWLAQGRLNWDAAPALYLHEYVSSGIAVRGLLGCLDISRVADDEAGRAVYPHEGIHPQQVAELATRMAAMQLNPAPILLVHRGPDDVRRTLREQSQRTPNREYEDRSGQRHRVWTIDDHDVIDQLQVGLSTSRMLIADGHHRYAAYLSMYAADPTEATRTGLAMVIDHAESPMFLGAIHRVLHQVSLPDFLRAAGAAGARVADAPDEASAIQALDRDVLVTTAGGRWATVSLPPDRELAAVEMLHRRIVPLLDRAPTQIGYVHGVTEALEPARRGHATAVLMPAPDLDMVERVVRSGRLLPEKATSFQPKPSLGSFMRSLHD